MAGRTTHSMLRGKGALARPELLAQLGLKVGDEIAIGRARFTIRGVIALEPGRSLSAFSLGPRVMVDYDDLAGTGLLAFGSRVVRQMLLRVPDDRIDTLTRDLQTELRPQFVRVRSYRDRQEQIGEDFRARRELPEPGGAGDRRARRHRRVQRDARVRAPEDQEHRRDEVRRRHQPADSLRVSRSRRLRLGLSGSLAGVAFAAAADRGHSRYAQPDRHADCDLRPVVVGGRCRALASACWCRCCSRWCRCSKCGRSSPRCCCVRRRPRRRVDWFQMGATVVVAGALVALASWQAASLRSGPERLSRVRRPDARAARPRLAPDAR